jgi:cell migration-inducing and hyaluronan-binding protein
MESGYKGGSQISFLWRLALAVMVCGVVVAGNGDRGARSFTTLAHGFTSWPRYHRRHHGRRGLAPAAETCTSGAIPPGDGTKDLEVIGPCTVSGGLYQYQNVNIYKDVAKGGAANGGSLTFTDATGAINFWVNSILIEDHGELIAGSQTAPFVGPLTIHLWGVEQNQNNSGLKGVGIPCKSPISEKFPFCGIPKDFWNSNPNPNPGSCVTASKVGDGKSLLPGGVDDCFYQYKPLNFDDGDPKAFFGYKVLAVSYGGKLEMFGAKGATYCASYPCPTNDPALSPSNTGTSWTRLDATLPGSGSEQFIVVADPGGAIRQNWGVGDKIVLGSTDYLPGHSELLTISSKGVVVDPDNANDSDVNIDEKIRWPHNGATYPLTEAKHPGITRLNLGFSSIETRAPVGLLSRNIRIVSDDTLGATDWPVAPGAFFGGHVIFRQAFEAVQVQGVEFYQLGQGGRIGHYPVHFHLARKVPPDTFVSDSSIWDSMTRWVVLHGAQGVTVQRDVGYLSIGHGFYLEDATETDNKLYGNLGVFARAAVLDPASVPLTQQHNPRQVPGILASPYPTTVEVPCGDTTCPCNGNPAAKCGTPQEQVPYHSDVDHPSVFWITNGWNDFEYNMADGAGTCGFCYWLTPAYISGPSRKEHWKSYAAEQRGEARAAMAPLEDFYGNSCSTAMNSFNVVGNTTACTGVVWGVDTNLPRVMPVTPDPKLVPTVNAANPRTQKTEDYYPNIDMGGGHFGTRCPEGTDCDTVNKCASGSDANCMVTVLDHYTSSFNWAQTNVAAIWLRPQWNLVLQSALTDVQNGGLTFVTGGDYTHSSAPPGVWELARKSVFVGETQPDNVWAFNAGPFNKNSGLTCDAPVPGNYCLSAKEEISMPKDNFVVNQRLFSIYDGPSYEDSNGFFDITPTSFTCKQVGNPEGTVGNCAESDYMYEQVRGLPKDKNNACYLPNAAIGWKQPNGFYYPPAFHSRNLFFDKVPIRHYVIEPAFQTTGLFKTDLEAVKKRYCNFSFDMFNNFSDIDRQTELDDDDGSLTGLVKTISVNQDAFFDAPYSTLECASDAATAVPTNPTNPNPGTANTSPYEYVSTVVFPDCGSTATCAGNGTAATNWNWSEDCANNTCYGVPLYRELITGTEKKAPRPTLKGIRMMGEKFYQRNTLTVNNGVYYMDTTVSKDTQVSDLHAANFTVFQASQPSQPRTYNVFFLFAKPSTTQTYSIYVGPGFNKDTDVKLVRANITVKEITFDTSDTLPSTWTKDYKAGVLTVTIDMNFPKFVTDYNDARMDACRPNSLCAWTGDATTGSCGCNANKLEVDYPDKNLVKECDGTNDAGLTGKVALCSWSVADVTCPKGGCYGFSFKLPNGFSTGTKPGLPPAPDCFPEWTNQNPPQPSPWNLPFVAASESLAGGAPPAGCFYSPTPGPDFCAPN